LHITEFYLLWKFEIFVHSFRLLFIFALMNSQEFSPAQLFCRTCRRSLCPLFSHRDLRLSFVLVSFVFSLCISALSGLLQVDPTSTQTPTFYITQPAYTLQLPFFPGIPLLIFGFLAHFDSNFRFFVLTFLLASLGKSSFSLFLASLICRCFVVVPQTIIFAFY